MKCLDFFTRDDGQYLITGSVDNTAKVCYVNSKYTNGPRSGKNANKPSFVFESDMGLAEKDVHSYTGSF